MLDDDFFRGKRILVTGASGFIGEHLCRRLSGLGAEVHGVSRRAQEPEPYCRWWQVQLDDQQSSRALIQSIQPDTLFHLASLVSGQRDMEVVLPALRSNLLSTVNLLVAATEAGCRKLVLTGSLEEPEGDVAIAIPASPYAAAKGAASTYARMFQALYGTPVVSARLFMVYGPNQKDANKLIPYVTRSLLRGEAPQLMSGTRNVDWIYVDDVVDAYLALARTSGIDGETIDVGSGALISVRGVVERLCNIVDTGIAPSFGSVSDRPMERVRAADVERSTRLTGWGPETSLEEGLARTVAWCRAQMKD